MRNGYQLKKKPVDVDIGGDDLEIIQENEELNLYSEKLPFIQRHRPFHADYSEVSHDESFRSTLWDEVDEDSTDQIHMINQDMRRWSVLDKLKSRYYCGRLGFVHAFNYKLILSIGMLALFTFLSVTFFSAIMLNTSPTTQGYDFIIVGSGSAGSTIARGLVSKGAKVLLLEAGKGTQYDLGGEENFGSKINQFDVPLLWSSLWQFSNYQFEDFNRNTGMILSKGLGGCGAQNGMIHNNPLPHDIDKWNTTNWKWKDVEAFILEKPSSSVGDSSTDQSMVSNLENKFIQVAQRFGLTWTLDLNNVTQSRRNVIGFYLMNILKGQRMCTARYMLSNWKLKSSVPLESLTNEEKKMLWNLDISLDSTVTSILFEKEMLSSQSKPTPHERFPEYTNRVIGVEYQKNGITKQVYLNPFKKISSNEKKMLANKWRDSNCVILTAGSIMTPKILMNSGIGSKEYLLQQGIRENIPLENVGNHLQDHYAIGMTFRTHPTTTSGIPSIYSLANQWAQYVQAANSVTDSSKYGVLGHPGYSVGAFLVSPYAFNQSIPDIQVTLYPTVMEPHYLQRRRKLFPNASEDNDQILITITLLQSDVRMKIRLNESDRWEGTVSIHLQDDSMTDTHRNLKTKINQHPKKPIRKPVAVTSPYPTGFLSRRDVDVLAWGIERVRVIMSESEMQFFIASETSPGMMPNETGDLSEWIQDNMYPTTNAVGTCAMGTDATHSVVDPELKVHGVQGLRIADASVIPYLPSGPIEATVVMIATRLVKIIFDKI